MTALASPLLWQLGLVCALGFALLWWLTLGARRRGRRRGLMQRLRELAPHANRAPGRSAALLATLDRARQAMQAGLRTPRARRLAIYRKPWFLVVDDGSGGTRPLLAAAQGQPAPGTPPTPNGADSPARAFWRWWLLEQMVAIEIDTVRADTPQAQEAALDWYDALLALCTRRDRFPLDGIVLCLDAQTLAGDPGDLATIAKAMQRMVHSASRHLRLRLPVYVVVHGLDTLGGYDLVRHLLPPEARTQAVGYRAPGDANVFARMPGFDDVFAPIAARLHSLRMALVRADSSAPARHASHVFIEQVLGLEPGLRALIEQVFAPTLTSRPRWQGLYFAAAPQQAAQAAFVADLFTHLLPVDQATARPRPPSR